MDRADFTNWDNSQRIGEGACPHCGASIDAVAGPKKLEPRDLALCIQCVELIIYDDQLKPRALTKRERDNLVISPRLRTLIRLMKQKKAANN